MFHFVMQGSGFLRGSGGDRYPLERFYLAVVPKGLRHTLECGDEVRQQLTIEAPPAGEGVVS